jgi:hypothetical protein
MDLHGRCRLLLGFAFAGMILHSALGAEEKFYAYNLTTRTEFEGLYLAPAGTQTWGPNQALNDKDKSLDVNERILLTGLSHARYDVKLSERKGGLASLAMLI